MKKNIFEREVLPDFEAHRADFLARARAVAEMLGTRQETVTVDDVRKLCPPPKEIDPRVMGAVFTTHGKKPRWEKVGGDRSGRRECHNRPIARFRYLG